MTRLFYLQSEESAVLVLAFIGGYVDSAGYIKLDGLFTSSITGNIVAAATAIFHNDGAFARFCVTIFFALAASASVLGILRLKLVDEWSRKSVGLLLFFLEALIMAIAIPIGLTYDNEIASDDAIFRWPLIVVGSILGASMGVHNAAAKEYIPNCPATTVMTMTLVSIAIAFPQMLLYSAAEKFDLKLCPRSKPVPLDYAAQIVSKSKTSTANFVKIIKPLVTFIIGAILGAVITNYISFWSITIPIALIIGIMLDIYFSDFVMPFQASDKEEDFSARPKNGHEEKMSVELLAKQPQNAGTQPLAGAAGENLYDKVEQDNNEQLAIAILDENEEEADLAPIPHGQISV